MTKTNEGFFNQDSWSLSDTVILNLRPDGWNGCDNMETGAWGGQFRQRKQPAQRSSSCKNLQKKKKILKEEQNDFSFYWVSPKVALKMWFWLSRKVFTLFHFNANSSNFLLLIPWLQVAPNLEAVGSKVFCESGHRSTNSVLAQNAKPTTLSWNKANSSIARTLVWQPNLEYPAGPQSLGWPVVPTLGV